MAQDGGPAFPTDEYFDEKKLGQIWGMTLRDYFAAKALMGMTASTPILDRTSDKINHAGWATAAYRFADAMLKEREK